MLSSQRVNLLGGHQGSQSFACFLFWPSCAERERIEMGGLFLVATLFINLSQMVCRAAVLGKLPRGRNKASGLVQVSLGECHPTQRVPALGQARGQTQLSAIDGIERNVTERGRRT